MFEDGSMATTAAVSVVNVAVHARSGAAVGTSSMSRRDWTSPCWHNFQLAMRADRPS
jgi:hypothetical protein